MCPVGAAVGAVPEMGGLCWPELCRGRLATERLCTASAEATI